MEEAKTRREPTDRVVQVKPQIDKVLSDNRCPKCNSRLQHAARRRYYCGHCRKRYRLVITLVKAELREDSRR